MRVKLMQSLTIIYSLGKAYEYLLRSSRLYFT